MLDKINAAASESSPGLEVPVKIYSPRSGLVLLSV
jgi:hypothetical protein